MYLRRLSACACHLKRPPLVGAEPRVIAGLPAGRLATMFNTVRRAVLPEPNSLAIQASMSSVCRASPYCT
eukprot:2091422-Pyramimonas_sp.AAC.1